MTNKMLNDLNRVVLLCNADLVDSRYVIKAYPEVFEDAWYFFMNVKVIEKARKELGNDYLKELEMFVMKHKEYRDEHKIPRNNPKESKEMKPHYIFMAGICFAAGLALLLLYFPPLAQSIFGEWGFRELSVGTAFSICLFIASTYYYYKSQ